MNAVVKAPTQTPAMAMVPQTFDQAMRLAESMARSKMVPVHFQGKPDDCLPIIELALRWEMSPYAVIQCASMIHNRPMLEGKLVAAVVNARGPIYGLTGRLRYDYSGDGDLRKITVSGQIGGREETIEVILRDAKTSNEWWKKQPDQQLAYHGARVWARRYMPELMLGVNSPEEMETEPVHREPPHAGPTLDARAEPVVEFPLLDNAKREASKGVAAYQQFWKELDNSRRGSLLAHHEALKATAAAADNAWLDALQLELAGAEGPEAINAIYERADVKAAREKLTNGAKQRLDDLIADAMDRVTQMET